MGGQVPPDRPREAGSEERETGPGAGPRRGQHDAEDPRHRQEHHQDHPDPGANTRSDARAERSGIDASGLVGMADDRHTVTLDRPHDPPEPEGPQVPIAGGHRGLDPIELPTHVGDRRLVGSWSQRFHGPDPPRV